MDHDQLSHRLAALADGAALGPAPDRRAAVRRRARAVRRRRAGAAGVGLAAAVVLVAPLPGMLRTTPDATLAGPSAPERRVATFAFPDTGAVAELVEVPGQVGTGRAARFVVRVRSERGRVGGVDLTFGDGRAQFLDGAARCTPGAGPTTVDLTGEHVYDAPGRYTVRAAPQVVTGCRGGLLQYSVAETTPATAVVHVR